MAGNDITLNIGANLTPAQRQLQAFVNQAQRQVGSQSFEFKLNEKGFRQPLGRITGDLNQFQGAMDASIARTLAFGASVGAIAGVTKAFKDMVAVTVKVEHALKEINVLLNLSTTDLSKFSKDLFGVAKNTASSFDTVAVAATEFSRQGLSAAETAKRVNSALILTRLSGLEAEASVSALTAAVNGFKREAVSTTEVVNRLANVDAAFAVSSADLAKALSRAGSVSQDAKVKFNELLAATTAVQQATARGGNVIGNGFKTIFTRLQRSKVREELEKIGVATTTATGDIRGAIDVLKDYARVYQTLSDQQKSYTSEQVAGVFQINTLKALVADLSNEYGVYNRALAVANNTTNEAVQRNAELNKTLQSLASQTGSEITQLAAKIGSISFEGNFKGILGFLKSALGDINSTLDSESLGGDLARGVMKGFGNFLTGPGLAIALVGMTKLLFFIGKQTSSALQQVLAIGSQGQKRQLVQQRINALLAEDNNLLRQIMSSSGNINDINQIVTRSINQQNAALANQKLLVQQIAAAYQLTKGGSIAPIPGGSGSRGRGAAEGFVPNLVRQERSSISRGVGGARSGDRPVVIPNFSFGGGKRGPMVAHTGEHIVPNFAGGGSAIFNRNMASSMGLPAGAKRVGAAKGFVPNFMGVQKKWDIKLAKDSQHGKKGATVEFDSGQIHYAQSKGFITPNAIKASGYKTTKQKDADRLKRAQKQLKAYDADAQGPGARGGFMAVPGAGAQVFSHVYETPQKLGKDQVKIIKGTAFGVNLNPQNAGAEEKRAISQLANVEEVISTNMVASINRVLSEVQAGGDLAAVPNTITKAGLEKTGKGAFFQKGGEGALGAVEGAVFEGLINAITTGLTQEGAHGKPGGAMAAKAKGSELDIVISKANEKFIEGLFNLPKGKYRAGDFKRASTSSTKTSFSKQLLTAATLGLIGSKTTMLSAAELQKLHDAGATVGDPTGLPGGRRPRKRRGKPEGYGGAGGFIPSFANLAGMASTPAGKRAMSTERALAGSARMGYDGRVGYGVFNHSQGSLTNAVSQHLSAGDSVSSLGSMGAAAQAAASAAAGFVPSFIEKITPFAGGASELKSFKQKATHQNKTEALVKKMNTSIEKLTGDTSMTSSQLKKTIRETVQNRAAAKSLGISTKKYDVQLKAATKQRKKRIKEEKGGGGMGTALAVSFIGQQVAGVIGSMLSRKGDFESQYTAGTINKTTQFAATGASLGAAAGPWGAAAGGIIGGVVGLASRLDPANKALEKLTQETNLAAAAQSKGNIALDNYVQAVSNYENESDPAKREGLEKELIVALAKLPPEIAASFQGVGTDLKAVMKVQRDLMKAQKDLANATALQMATAMETAAVEGGGYLKKGWEQFQANYAVGIRGLQGAMGDERYQGKNPVELMQGKWYDQMQKNLGKDAPQIEQMRRQVGMEIAAQVAVSSGGKDLLDEDYTSKETGKSDDMVNVLKNVAAVLMDPTISEGDKDNARAIAKQLNVETVGGLFKRLGADVSNFDSIVNKSSKRLDELTGWDKDVSTPIEQVLESLSLIGSQPEVVRKTAQDLIKALDETQRAFTGAIKELTKAFSKRAATAKFIGAVGGVGKSFLGALPAGAITPEEKREKIFNIDSQKIDREGRLAQEKQNLTFYDKVVKAQEEAQKGEGEGELAKELTKLMEEIAKGTSVEEMLAAATLEDDKTIIDLLREQLDAEKGIKTATERQHDLLKLNNLREKAIAEEGRRKKTRDALESPKYTKELGFKLRSAVDRITGREERGKTGGTNILAQKLQAEDYQFIMSNFGDMLSKELGDQYNKEIAGRRSFTAMAEMTDMLAPGMRPRGQEFAGVQDYVGQLIPQLKDKLLDPNLSERDRARYKVLLDIAKNTQRAYEVSKERKAFEERKQQILVSNQLAAGPSIQQGFGEAGMKLQQEGLMRAANDLERKLKAYKESESTDPKGAKTKDLESTLRAELLAILGDTDANREHVEKLPMKDLVANLEGYTETQRTVIATIDKEIDEIRANRLATQKLTGSTDSAATALDLLRGKINELLVNGIKLISPETSPEDLEGNARGHLPSAAGGNVANAFARERRDISNRVGGAIPGVDQPRLINNFNGGPVVAHTGEYLVDNYKGGGKSAIFNRSMVGEMGMPAGARVINAANGGYEGTGGGGGFGKKEKEKFDWKKRAGSRPGGLRGVAGPLWNLIFPKRNKQGGVNVPRDWRKEGKYRSQADYLAEMFGEDHDATISMRAYEATAQGVLSSVGLSPGRAGLDAFGFEGEPNVKLLAQQALMLRNLEGVRKVPDKDEAHLKLAAKAQAEDRIRSSEAISQYNKSTPGRRLSETKYLGGSGPGKSGVRLGGALPLPVWTGRLRAATTPSPLMHHENFEQKFRDKVWEDRVEKIRTDKQRVTGQRRRQGEAPSNFRGTGRLARSPFSRGYIPNKANGTNWSDSGSTGGSRGGGGFGEDDLKRLYPPYMVRGESLDDSKAEQEIVGKAWGDVVATYLEMGFIDENKAGALFASPPTAGDVRITTPGVIAETLGEDGDAFYDSSKDHGAGSKTVIMPGDLLLRAPELFEGLTRNEMAHMLSDRLGNLSSMDPAIIKKRHDAVKKWYTEKLTDEDRIRFDTLHGNPHQGIMHPSTDYGQHAGMNPGLAVEEMLSTIMQMYIPHVASGYIPNRANGSGYDGSGGSGGFGKNFVTQFIPGYEWFMQSIRDKIDEDEPYPYGQGLPDIPVVPVTPAEDPGTLGKRPTKPMEGTGTLGKRPTKPMEGTGTLGKRPTKPMEGTGTLGKRPTKPMEGTGTLGKRPTKPFESTGGTLGRRPTKPMESTGGTLGKRPTGTGFNHGIPSNFGKFDERKAEQLKAWWLRATPEQKRAAAKAMTEREKIRQDAENKKSGFDTGKGGFNTDIDSGFNKAYGYIPNRANGTDWSYDPSTGGGGFGVEIKDKDKYPPFFIGRPPGGEGTPIGSGVLRPTPGPKPKPTPFKEGYPDPTRFYDKTWEDMLAIAQEAGYLEDVYKSNLQTGGVLPGTTYEQYLDSMYNTQGPGENLTIEDLDTTTIFPGAVPPGFDPTGVDAMYNPATKTASINPRIFEQGPRATQEALYNEMANHLFRITNWDDSATRIFIHNLMKKMTPAEIKRLEEEAAKYGGHVMETASSAVEIIGMQTSPFAKASGYIPNRANGTGYVGGGGGGGFGVGGGRPSAPDGFFVRLKNGKLTPEDYIYMSQRDVYRKNQNTPSPPDEEWPFGKDLPDIPFKPDDPIQDMIDEFLESIEDPQQQGPSLDEPPIKPKYYDHEAAKTGKPAPVRPWGAPGRQAFSISRDMRSDVLKKEFEEREQYIKDNPVPGHVKGGDGSYGVGSAVEMRANQPPTNMTPHAPIPRKEKGGTAFGGFDGKLLPGMQKHFDKVKQKNKKIKVPPHAIEAMEMGYGVNKPIPASVAETGPPRDWAAFGEKVSREDYVQEYRKWEKDQLEGKKKESLRESNVKDKAGRAQWRIWVERWNEQNSPASGDIPNRSEGYDGGGVGGFGKDDKYPPFFIGRPPGGEGPSQYTPIGSRVLRPTPGPKPKPWTKRQAEIKSAELMGLTREDRLQLLKADLLNPKRLFDKAVGAPRPPAGPLPPIRALPPITPFKAVPFNPYVPTKPFEPETHFMRPTGPDWLTAPYDKRRIPNKSEGYQGIGGTYGFAMSPPKRPSGRPDGFYERLQNGTLTPEDRAWDAINFQWQKDFDKYSEAVNEPWTPEWLYNQERRLDAWWRRWHELDMPLLADFPYTDDDMSDYVSLDDRPRPMGFVRDDPATHPKATGVTPMYPGAVNPKDVYRQHPTPHIYGQDYQPPITIDGKEDNPLIMKVPPADPKIRRRRIPNKASGYIPNLAYPGAPGRGGRGTVRPNTGRKSRDKLARLQAAVARGDMTVEEARRELGVGRPAKPMFRESKLHKVSKESKLHGLSKKMSAKAQTFIGSLGVTKWSKNREAKRVAEAQRRKDKVAADAKSDEEMRQRPIIQAQAHKAKIANLREREGKYVHGIKEDLVGSEFAHNVGMDTQHADQAQKAKYRQAVTDSINKDSATKFESEQGARAFASTQRQQLFDTRLKEARKSAVDPKYLMKRKKERDQQRFLSQHAAKEASRKEEAGKTFFDRHGFHKPKGVYLLPSQIKRYEEQAARSRRENQPKYTRGLTSLADIGKASPGGRMSEYAKNELRIEQARRAYTEARGGMVNKAGRFSGSSTSPDYFNFRMGQYAPPISETENTSGTVSSPGLLEYQGYDPDATEGNTKTYSSTAYPEGYSKTRAYKIEQYMKKRTEGGAPSRPSGFGGVKKFGSNMRPSGFGGVKKFGSGPSLFEKRKKETAEKRKKRRNRAEGYIPNLSMGEPMISSMNASNEFLSFSEGEAQAQATQTAPVGAGLEELLGTEGQQARITMAKASQEKHNVNVNIEVYGNVSQGAVDGIQSNSSDMASILEGLVNGGM